MLQNRFRSVLSRHFERTSPATMLLVALLVPVPGLQAAIPVPIKDINTRTDGGSIFLGAEKDGFLYYGGCYEEDFFGCELVRTPVGGTGVERVKDINPGQDGSNPHTFVNANGTVFFVANSNELWKSDGTEAGTQRVQTFVQIRTGDGERPVALGNEVVFKAESWSGFGRELWVTDGTTTTQFQTCSGSCDGEPYGLTVSGNRVFFRAYDGSDTELYKYEPGTSAPGTVSQIGDIHTSGSSFPTNITPLSGGVIFQATGDTLPSGTELGLYTSDGFGNTKVAGSSEFFYGLTEMVSTGSIAFFDAFDGNFVSGREIWISNGLTAGTGIIADINPGVPSSDPQDLTVVGNSVFFSANDGNGRDLFISPAGAGAFPLEVCAGSPTSMAAASSSSPTTAPGPAASRGSATARLPELTCWAISIRDRTRASANRSSPPADLPSFPPMLSTAGTSSGGTASPAASPSSPSSALRPAVERRTALHRSAASPISAPTMESTAQNSGARTARRREPSSSTTSTRRALAAASATRASSSQAARSTTQATTAPTGVSTKATVLRGDRYSSRTSSTLPNSSPSTTAFSTSPLTMEPAQAESCGSRTAQPEERLWSRISIPEHFRPTSRT